MYIHFVVWMYSNLHLIEMLMCIILLVVGIFYLDVIDNNASAWAKDVILQALNLVVGMCLQPFEGVYNICTYTIVFLYHGMSL